MWVKTDKGRTECRFASLVEIEPLVEKVRAGYRQACAENPNKMDEHKARVLAWCEPRFGARPFHRDFDALNPPEVTPTGVAHGGGAGVKRWDDFIASKEPAFLRRYLSHEVVAGCIMGEDE